MELQRASIIWQVGCVMSNVLEAIAVAALTILLVPAAAVLLTILTVLVAQ